MKHLLQAATTIALLASCSSMHEPKTLNGRHRTPINGQPVAINHAPALPSRAAVIAPSPEPAVFALAEPVAPVGAETCTNTAEISAAPPAATQAASVHSEIRTFRVFFEHGEAQLAVPPSMEPKLLAAARAAERIVVRGRTDGATQSAGDEAVALQRALAARRYLIAQGIPATLIDLQFASAADYLADNKTAQGRDKNRRVEFVFSLSDTTPRT